MTNRIEVTKENVQRVSDALSRSAMEDMGCADGSREWKLYLAVGLGGEAGELLNIVKKLARDGTSPEMLQKLAYEIADVQAYLNHLAEQFFIDAEQAFIFKTSEVINNRQPAWARHARKYLEIEGVIPGDGPSSLNT